MPRQGLNKEAIVEKSIELIEETGDEQISLRKLASSLNVKAASLYNHVNGLEEIKTAIGLRAIDMLNSALAEGVSGKERDEAIKAAAEAYRSFAKDHTGIYRTIMEVPAKGGSILNKEWPHSFRPLLDIIETYKIIETDKIDFFRYLRSAIHGFVSLEKSGFLKDPRITTEKSFANMIMALIETLHAMEQKNLHEDDR